MSMRIAMLIVNGTVLHATTSTKLPTCCGFRTILRLSPNELVFQNAEKEKATELPLLKYQHKKKDGDEAGDPMEKEQLFGYPLRCFRVVRLWRLLVCLRLCYPCPKSRRKLRRTKRRLLWMLSIYCDSRLWGQQNLNRNCIDQCAADARCRGLFQVESCDVFCMLTMHSHETSTSEGRQASNIFCLLLVIAHDSFSISQAKKI